MNKNLLLDILGESSALRNWIAQQLIVGLDYPMPRQTIESLLAESSVFRNWALDQFDGEFLYLKTVAKEDATQKVLDKVFSLLREGSKIPAIKYLRVASRDGAIREGLMKEFASFVFNFKFGEGEDVSYVSEFGEQFSLKFSRKLVEYIASDL